MSTITIRMAGPGDDALFARVAHDVFDHALQPALIAEFLNDQRHHIALALDGDLVVGMATAVHYIHPDQPAQLWINELGVALTHQGHGIAKRLLRAVFDTGRAAGCVEAWVGTESGNATARNVYKAVGGHEQEMVYITFDLADDATR